MIPLLFNVLFAIIVVAYVPAQPTNSTQAAIAGGLNITDISKLRLHWYPSGTDAENVSYELAGKDSTGISKGVLIHFSEEWANETTPPTSAPWIAMVSCDRNASGASLETDVFTLARDKGAVAAVLYSLHSLACVINPEYTDPDTFDQVFDIFSTQSRTSAHLIEYQFGQLASPNASFVRYDSQHLNNSAADIEASIERGYATARGFLYAVLQAYNATVDGDDPPVTDSENGVTNEANTSSSNNTALAMIILYAITGCVSGLFCVVIISGAIRALRYPERYGPRAHLGLNGPPQSRARGLTRAILDTFPVVKFGGGGTTSLGDGTAGASGAAATRERSMSKDPEAQELSEWEVLDQNAANRQSAFLTKNGEMTMAPAGSGMQGVPSQQEGTANVSPNASSGSNPTNQSSSVPYSHSSGTRLTSSPNPNPMEGTSSPRVSNTTPMNSHASPSSTSEAPTRERSNTQNDIAVRDDLSPESMGREVCPICIVDFEEGDDLRVLPCEGKHMFHQQCVDPWLLELSSSCPICRHDFLALETMLSDEDNATTSGNGTTHGRSRRNAAGVEPDEFGVDGPSPHTHSNSHGRRSLYGTAANRFSRYLKFASRRRHRHEQERRAEEIEEQEQVPQQGLSGQPQERPHSHVQPLENSHVAATSGI